MTRKFNLYFNSVTQVSQNTEYPRSKEVESIDDLKQVVCYDHVSSKFKDNYRKNENFLESNCHIFDVDNTESDNKNDWIHPQDIAKAFNNVLFYVVYSRNHMKEKNGKAPRPKFHVYFPDIIFKDRKTLQEFKTKVCDYFEKFDKNAKDVGRFFYGVKNPEIEYFEGDMLLSSFINRIKPDVAKQIPKQKENDRIPEGSRNNTMFKIAIKLLRNSSVTMHEAEEQFLKQSLRCSPPLEAKELFGIWESAKKYKNETSFFELPIVDSNIQNQLFLSSNKALDISVTESFLKMFGIKFCYNEMTFTFEVTGLHENYSGADEVDLLVTLLSESARKIGYKYSSEKNIYSMLKVIAHKNKYHPVLNLLAKNKWDKEDRLPEIYRILGITESFHKTLFKRWALQTIATLYNSNANPISAQGVLTLQGEQGCGKTEFFRHLAIRSQFFKEGATIDMSNKDTLMSATKVWICELGELDATTRKDQSSLKAFITASEDRYREPYARSEKIRMRRTSFCATVNPKEFLIDTTGNRRFWTIPIKKIDLKAVFEYTPEWYLQFWCQIHEEYRRNPKSYLLTKEEEKIVNEQNADFEASVHGENEFMNIFDTQAELGKWTYTTAATICKKLNECFPKLNIQSTSFGRNLVPRLEKRTGKEFTRKKIKGERCILCPPLKSFSKNMHVKKSGELPDYQDVMDK